MIEGLPTYWLVPWPIKLFKFYIYTSVIYVCTVYYVTDVMVNMYICMYVFSHMYNDISPEME